MNFLSHPTVADACRNTVQRELQYRFSSPDDAKAEYKLANKTNSSCPMMNNCVLSGTGQTISELSREEQIGVVTKLFQEYALLHYERVYPSDYLILSLEAMVQLDRGGRTNVMYNLAKAIGTKRPNSQESRLPVSRMPMGLIEYCSNFFCSSDMQQVC